jgi:hypothetical protein
MIWPRLAMLPWLCLLASHSCSHTARSLCASTALALPALGLANMAWSMFALESQSRSQGKATSCVGPTDYAMGRGGPCMLCCLRLRSWHSSSVRPWRPRISWGQLGTGLIGSSSERGVASKFSKSPYTPYSPEDEMRLDLRKMIWEIESFFSKAPPDPGTP